MWEEEGNLWEAEGNMWEEEGNEDIYFTSIRLLTNKWELIWYNYLDWEIKLGVDDCNP